MKNIGESFLAFFITFALFYFLGSFANASFNINNWTEFSRNGVSIIGGLFSIVAFTIVFDR